MGVSAKEVSVWIFTLVVLAGSLLGCIAYAYLGDHRGRPSNVLVNYFINTWATITLCHVTIQSLFIQQARKPENCAKISVLADSLLYSFLAVVYLLTTIFWGMFGRVDLPIWSAVTALMCTLNVLLLAIPALRRKTKKPDSTTEHYQQQYHDRDVLEDPFNIYQNNSKPVFQARDVFVTPPNTKSLEEAKKFHCSRRRDCPKCIVILGKVAVWLLKFSFLFVAILQLLSAMNHGTGAQNYKPSDADNFLEWTVPGGKVQKASYRCQGQNTSLPTLIFESDGSHGIGDWFGILNALQKDGDHKVCVWDKPGLGFSDYLYAFQTDDSKYYDQLVASLMDKEPEFGPPFIFVGWGGGGHAVFEYTMKAPDNVHALVMLDSQPEDINYRIAKDVYNLTDQEIQEEFDNEMASRMNWFYIINIFGVPLGLINIFYPKTEPSEFWNQAEVEEKDWYFLTEKTWITQRWYMDFFQPNPGNFFDQQLPNNIPLYHIMTKKTDAQIESQKCVPQNLDDSECEKRKEYNRLTYEDKAKTPQNGGEVVDCTEDDCNLGYYVFDHPEYTVRKINEIFSL